MNSTTKAASFQITSPQSPWYPKHTGPSFEGARVINLLSKRGAEGQSRTDTGSQVRLGPMVKDHAVGSVAVKRGLRYTAGKELWSLKPGKRCISCKSPLDRLEVL